MTPTGALPDPRVIHESPEAGVSLIELVIAIFVFSLVVVASVGYLQMGTKQWRGQQERLERQQQSRIAMALLSAELSEAGRGDDLSGEPVYRSDPGAVGFLLDDRRILYRIGPESGAVRLLRSVDGGTNEVAYGLGGLVLTYLGPEGRPMRSGEQPVIVQIKLTSSEIHRNGRDPWRTDLGTEVWLRNGQ